METVGAYFDVQVSYYKDLSASQMKHDRSSVGGTYMIWTDNLDSAPIDLANYSATDAESESVAGLTLIEYLRIHLFHFFETGGHMDTSTYTVCSGSRDADGDVPVVHWSARNKRLEILWHSSEARVSDCYVRQVVV